MLRILPLFFAALARAAVLPVITPNDPLHGDSRGGVASEQAVCSDIGRNALVLGVCPYSPSSVSKDAKY